jgi:hypothetical protein
VQSGGHEDVRLPMIRSRWVGHRWRGASSSLFRHMVSDFVDAAGIRQQRTYVKAAEIARESIASIESANVRVEDGPGGTRACPG